MQKSFYFLKYFIIGLAILCGAVPAFAQVNIGGYGTSYNNPPTIVDGDIPASLTVAGDEEQEFPLKHTAVTADISAFVAEVEVRQEYYNPFTEPVEAIYKFPLPHDGAVYAMEMHIGDRVITAEIKTRVEAAAIYEQAKDQGQRAALLEQERPNIFTQSVANILPGEQIDIVIRYTETLEFQDKNYEFVFPMVVGPRYIPGSYVEDYFSPSVSDADRINPPILPEGMRSGHDIELEATITTGGIPITNVSSAQHAITTTIVADDTVRVSLDEEDSIPNKDFVLRYELASDKPQFGFFTYAPAGEDGYFCLIAQPQTEFTTAQVTPKEMFFIVDTSGSMSGEPIEKVKDAMSYALQNLNPEDSFYFMTFSNTVERLSSEPLPNTPATIMQGLNFVNAIEAGGGTNMLPGVIEALRYPQNPNKLRIIAIMSDGYIGNESEVLGAVQDYLGDQTRLFSFGIGSSMNRYLMDEMGELGRGGVYYVTLGDESSKVVAEFYERIQSPLLTDLMIDWGTASVSELYPTLYPDLFAGEPIVVFGRYAQPTETTISITGREGEISEGLGNEILKLLLGTSANIHRTEEVFNLAASFPQTSTENEWVGRLWARNKIDTLMDQLNTRAYFPEGRMAQSDVEAAITALGLGHALVTQYTSFVAVDQEVVVDPDQETQTVEVPVPLPEGTTYEGFFGSSSDVSFGAAKSLPAPLGATFGLGTADLESSYINIMIWIATFVVVLLVVALIVTAIYLRIKRKDGKQRKFWNIFNGRMSKKSKSI